MFGEGDTWKLYTQSYSELGTSSTISVTEYPTQLGVLAEIQTYSALLRSLSQKNGNEWLGCWGVDTDGTARILTPNPISGHDNGFYAAHLEQAERQSLGKKIVGVIHSHAGQKRGKELSNSNQVQLAEIQNMETTIQALKLDPQLSSEKVISLEKTLAQLKTQVQALGSKIDTIRDVNRLSAGDLAAFILGEDLFSGIAGPQQDVFAFRCKETHIIPPETGRFYLMGAAIFEYEMLKSFGETWEFNLAVAEKYQFALYRGLPGERLKRAYP